MWTMGDIFVLLEANRPTFGPVFQRHSLTRKRKFRCQDGKRRDPKQDPDIRRPHCIPCRKALGSASKVIKLGRYKHRRYISGPGHKEDRTRKRWRRLRDPLLRAQKSAGEAFTMGDMFLLAESFDVARLGERAFWARIDAAPADRYITSEVIDWGSTRGQGRRRGGMVMGGMSDPPRGKKSYSRVLGSAPLDARQREEASLLDQSQQALIAQALAAGFSAEVALTVAYTRGANPISRSEAYAIVAGG